jgi:transforming growth factor-beta-induced protein
MISLRFTLPSTVLIASLALAGCGSTTSSSSTSTDDAATTDDAAAGSDTTTAADTATATDTTTTGDTTAAPKTIVEIAVSDPQFSTLVAAVTAAGLVDTLKSAGPFTVFAPTNDAFAKIPKADLDALLKDKAKLTGVLTHHAIAGKVEAKDVKTGIVTMLDGTDVLLTVGKDGVTIGAAKIIKTDIQASNGVIHVIDAVIVPPADIVATAVAAGSFSTLAAALTAADLVATLQGKGPFTVFAPNDAAFAKIPKADIDALLADKAKLTAILTYHVVGAKVYAKDVKAGAVKTVNGADLTIAIDGMGGVTVNDAKVIATDVIASNGVIHIIDKVVLPPQP